MTLEFRITGPAALLRNGASVRLHSAKALALLAYLACQGNAIHSREKLAELLWGDAPGEAARHSLRQALYSIRGALGTLAGQALREEAGAIGFTLVPELHIDLDEVRRIAADRTAGLEALRQAARSYRGVLLEGLPVVDCPGFEEWLDLERHRLEQQVIGVMQRLMDALITAGAYQEALDAGARLLTIDTLNEGTYCCLMRAYAGLGDQGAVRRQYRMCRELLQNELAAEPSAVTSALYEQLTRDLSKPEAAPAPGTRGAFVGRERELGRLRAHLDQVLAGVPSLVLVSGEVGIGKTHLLAEFLRRSAADHADLRWLWGAGYEAENHAPYAVWADVLAPLGTTDWQSVLTGLAEPWRRQLSRLVPGLAPPANDMPGATIEESRLRLLQGVTEGLKELAQAAPLVVVLDDLHWADESSLELLHYTLRHLTTGQRLLLVGTYQPGAVVDNPRLQAILNAGRHAEVKLPALDQETVGRLLEQLPTPMPAGLGSRLHAECGGNPLLALETARALLESGRLADAITGGALPVPEKMLSLVRSRVAALSDAARRLLAATAVIGRPCNLALLSEVTGRTELELLAPLEHLMDHAFLHERSVAPVGMTIDFHHEYVRRILYEQLSHSERRLLHLRAAEALLARHVAKSQAAVEEVAYHFEQAGDVQAIDHLILAAEQAQAFYALAHATDLYTRALACLAVQAAGDAVRRFEILLAREALLEAQGRRPEQAEDVAALLALAEQMGDARRQAVAQVRLAGLASYTGRPADARQAGERALALYRGLDDRHGTARALRELGFLCWSSGNLGDALAYNRDALQLHRQLGDIEGEATALHNLGEIYRGLGSPRQGLAHYEQALSLEWARQDHRRQGLTLYGMAHTRRELHDRAGALAGYHQALVETERANDRLMASRATHALASLLSEDDASLSEAIAYMRQALDISRSIGYGYGIAHGLANLAYLHARRFDTGDAQQYLKEALTWFRLIEDEAGLQEVAADLAAMIESVQDGLEPPVSMRWVKSHVPLAEGKVYCEFESPLAQQRSMAD